ncbi:hypothetical protein L614_002400000290 [Ochrobactrum sp. J50]|uniref:hypothetical protein n=1 Tax=Brucella/Ochrobactrum group TaxID=2826938 RepID=UPI0011ADC780|nr:MULTISPECIES: hypothetical protein [Brucella/Ochrobactrum group]TWH01423.1 hypothetical protein L614_002400000290 [Ochrobactrum sp. J50]WPM80956.1 hypothetical protein R5W60_04455 [Brucella pseudintermedia]
MSSCDLAGRYVREMTDREAKGWGDHSNALKRLSRRYGLSYWTLNNLRIGRSKTVEASIFKRVQTAYFDYCERQIAQLQHELELEKAVSGDADMENLVGEASQLLAKVREAKEASKANIRAHGG